MRKLFLYTTSGCHLCELAEKILQPIIIHLNRINADSAESMQLCPVEITDDAELFERYGIRIPVIEFADSDEELRWPFTDEEAFVFLASKRAKT